MTTPAGDVDPERAASRAELLPEEAAFEIQDPHALAEEVLAESDDRTADPERGARESGQSAEH